MLATLVEQRRISLFFCNYGVFIAFTCGLLASLFPENILSS